MRNHVWIIYIYRSIFSSIFDVRLEQVNDMEDPTDEVGFSHSRAGMRTPTGSRNRTSMSGQRSNTPPKIDKRLTEIYVSKLITIVKI